MERQLQEDLNEALEGLDPLELLVQDPELAEVAEDLFSQPLTTMLPKGQLFSAEENPNGYLTKRNTNSPTLATKQGQAPAEFSIHGSSRIGSKDAQRREKCKVCQQPAKGHVHFGALVCTSCRAFFSRAIKNNAFEEFACANDLLQNQCQIDSGSYKSCKKCRFTKCLQNGMRVPYKQTQNNQGLYNQSPHFVKHLRGALSFCDNITADEKLLLRDLTLNRFNLRMERRAKFITSNLDTYRQALQRYYGGQNFSLSTLKLYEDFMVYGQIQAFADSGELVDNLTKRDRTKLLSRNLALSLEFFEAYRLGILPMNNMDFSKHIEAILNQLNPSEKMKYDEIKNQVSKNGLLDPKAIR